MQRQGGPPYAERASALSGRLQAERRGQTKVDAGPVPVCAALVQPALVLVEEPATVLTSTSINTRISALIA